MQDTTTGNNRGFGFVTFTDQEGADRALAEKNHCIKGKRVDCRPSLPKSALQEVAGGEASKNMVAPRLRGNDPSSNRSVNGKNKRQLIQSPSSSGNNATREADLTTLLKENTATTNDNTTTLNVNQVTADVNSATDEVGPSLTNVSAPPAQINGAWMQQQHQQQHQHPVMWPQNPAHPVQLYCPPGMVPPMPYPYVYPQPVPAPYYPCHPMMAPSHMPYQWPPIVHHHPESMMPNSVAVKDVAIRYYRTPTEA